MFIICTDPSDHRAGSQLSVTPSGDLVGICRANERAEFADREGAEALLATVPERTRAFHFLIVHETRPARHVGGNGWMVGHPGYALA